MKRTRPRHCLPLASSALLGSLIASSGILVLPTAAFAQAAQTGAPDVIATTPLEEILVTAQRREERTVDVPISIAVLSQNALTTANVQTLADIQQLTPSLRFDNQAGFAQPVIRGIGTAVTTSGGGANVGIYINGFYSPNPLAADFQLMNVSSVQVLKGPQGTLFGHNTTGGAILVTTPDPSTETHAEAKVNYGSFNAQRYQTYATTGLFGGIVATDIEGLFSKGNGFITNIVNGDDHVDAYQDWTVRGGLKINFSNDASALFRYTHSVQDNPTTVLTNSNTDTSIDPTTGKPWGIQTFAAPGLYTTDPSRVASDLPTYFIAKTDIAQLTVKADVGFANITSLSQWRREDVEQSLNEDATALPILQLGLPIFDRTISQEIFLSSKPGSRLQWTAGGFFFSNTDTYVVYLDNFVHTPVGRVRLGGSSTTTKNYAGYLDATYELTPQWFLTVGARYSHDVVTDAYWNPGPPNNSNQQNQVPGISSDKTTPRVVLRYKPTEQSSVYASYAEGYKAAIIDVGGSCQDSFDNFTCNNVKPEELKAYEVGYKLDTRRFTMQAAVYYYDYKDLQVSEYLGNAQAYIVNAARSELYGVEDDIHFELNDNFSVNGAAAWNHARYVQFGNATVGAPLYASCPPRPNAIPGCQSPINYDYVNTSTILRGVPMQYAPEWTANIGPRYTTDMTATGEYIFSANWYYTSQFWSSPSGTQFLQPSYNTLALRAEWKDPSKRFHAALYGENVTNARYRTTVQYTGEGIGAQWSQPASWGIELGAKF